LWHQQVRRHFTAREISTGRHFAIKPQPMFNDYCDMIGFNDLAVGETRPTLKEILTTYYLKHSPLVRQIDSVYSHAPYLATVTELFGVSTPDDGVLALLTYDDYCNFAARYLGY